MRIFDSGKKSAAENMLLDEKLLNDLKSSPEPILHLYEWQSDAATYGHFINPNDFFNMQEVESKKFDLAKRPTGGGIVFHTTDLAFSVLIPFNHHGFSLSSLDNYIFVNEKVKQAIRGFHSFDVTLLEQEKSDVKKEVFNFCMAKPTIYDVMLGGKKVGGAAQRKTKFGFLHQGSIFMAPLQKEFLQVVLKQGSLVCEAIEQNSFPLLKKIDNPKELKVAKEDLKFHLIEVFRDV